jgi:hypothetical protein
MADLFEPLLRVSAVFRGSWQAGCAPAIGLPDGTGCAATAADVRLPVRA